MRSNNIPNKRVGGVNHDCGIHRKLRSYVVKQTIHCKHSSNIHFHNYRNSVVVQ